MSTSDTPDIDEKKETSDTASNNFNVIGFIKDAITKFIYLLIYVFVSALVLYGTKIYGPKIPEQSSSLWSKLQAAVSNFTPKFTKGGNSKEKIEDVFDNFKISYIQPERPDIMKNMAFMKKQLNDTYGYTLEALIFFFNFLYKFDSDNLVAIFGPILFGIMALGLTLFGFIVFIYFYISNLFYNFNIRTNPFISCFLVMFCIMLLFMLFTIIPFIQIIVFVYCLVNIFGYPSKTTLEGGKVVKSNFYGFMSIFVSHFYNYIMMASAYIIVTSSMTYLGQEYGIICALIILLDYTGTLDIGLFKKKQKPPAK